MLRIPTLSLLLAGGLMAQAPVAPAKGPVAVTAGPSRMEGVAAQAIQALVARHGEGERSRIETGVRQVVRAWRDSDGSPEELSAFLGAHYAGTEDARKALLDRFEFLLESLEGHQLEMGRDLRWFSDLELGAELPIDTLSSGFDPGAHLVEDLFASRMAFVALLNFPATTLETRLKEGTGWTRRQWAEARLVDRFSRRVPAEVNQMLAMASGEAERYIAGMNFWMHHMLDEKGRRLFPAGQRLLSHWNLRDEIKSQYAKGAEGRERQRLIQALMNRIVAQEVPAQVIDNPLVDWSPYVPGVVKASPVADAGKPLPAKLEVSAAPEGDARYARILANFKAQRAMDAHSPLQPTHVLRAFEEGRQIPEARVKAILEEVCGSPMVAKVGKVIEARLGRKLEPFDLWYAGFRSGSNLDEKALDAQVRQRYPNAAAFEKDLPRIIQAVGFTAEKAAWLSERIAVDPARGSGHAMGAQRKGDKAHLRTRIPKEGMDYKGFNIAVHELGHNVEQTFSLYGMDHWLLNGVPNTAFTEAMAFTFQARDLQVLGLPAPGPEAKRESVLNEFWQTLEIAGVGLVDLEMWNWLYAHPDATPAQLKAAVVKISRDIWNRYYAPTFGQKDQTLLAIYSHMVNNQLYLPDYPLGHLIAFQVGEHLEKAGPLGAEIERMCRLGRLSPDLWMVQATGRPVGAESLLEATRKVLAK